ncbi:MAG: hypothetical protein J7K87_00240 [Candidatus Aenigmarchaeota archaeon]|nr:hypothetical protein [Candidatus Aenigmarchaeota archaeon]
MANDSVTLSYFAKALNALGQEIEMIKRMDKATYEFMKQVASSQKKPKEPSNWSYTMYEPLEKINEDINIYPDKITGEPKRTEVTSTYRAVRIIGEEDLVSVFTNMPLIQCSIGILGGNLEATVSHDYKPLSSDDNIINTVATVNYRLSSDGDKESTEIPYIERIDDLEKKFGEMNEYLGNLGREVNGIKVIVASNMAKERVEQYYKDNENKSEERGTNREAHVSYGS